MARASIKFRATGVGGGRGGTRPHRRPAAPKMPNVAKVRKPNGPRKA